MSRWILIVLMAAFLGACGGDSPQAPEAEFPLAPAFALNDVDGNPQALHSYRGKVVVLNFFATWCAPCQVEMPQLEAHIWQVYRDRGIVVLGIDLQEDLGQVKLYAVNNGLTFPLVIDPSGELFRDYAGGSVPYNVVVDPEGQIRYAQAGYEEATMIRLIDQLLDAGG